MEPAAKIAIKEWQDLIQKKKILKRDVFSEIEATLHIPAITTILGPRRVGKSCAAMWMVKKHGGIYINFEDERFPKDPSFIREVHDQHPDGLLVLDEVHLVKGWERVASAIRNFRKIIVTSSTSQITTKKYGSFLTGRHVSVLVFPLSFQEFQRFCEKDYDTYLKIGGYPEVVLSNARILLGDYLTDIVFRDLRGENGKLLEMVKFILAHSSKRFSERRLANVFNLSPNTIGRYLEQMLDVYLIAKSPVFHPKLSVRDRLPFKVYAADHAYINFLNPDSGWKGRALETAVYWEFRRRGFDVFHGWNPEIDLVICKGQKVLGAVNVCYHIYKANLQREEKLSESRAKVKAIVAVEGSSSFPTFRPWEIDKLVEEIFKGAQPD